MEYDYSGGLFPPRSYFVVWILLRFPSLVAFVRKSYSLCPNSERRINDQGGRVCWVNLTKTLQSSWWALRVMCGQRSCAAFHWDTRHFILFLQLRILFERRSDSCVQLGYKIAKEAYKTKRNYFLKKDYWIRRNWTVFSINILLSLPQYLFNNE